MPTVKAKKPAKFTPRVKFAFFVYPVGQLVTENIFALFESHGLMLADRDIVRLQLAGGPVPTWPIPRDAMFQLYRTTQFRWYDDYRLFRKNPGTGAVTAVPRSYFQRVRNDPVVKATRTALATLRAAKAKRPAAAAKTAAKTR